MKLGKNETSGKTRKHFFIEFLANYRKNRIATNDQRGIMATDKEKKLDNIDNTMINVKSIT